MAHIRHRFVNLVPNTLWYRLALHLTPIWKRWSDTHPIESHPSLPPIESEHIITHPWIWRLLPLSRKHKWTILPLGPRIIAVRNSWSGTKEDIESIGVAHFDSLEEMNRNTFSVN